MKMMTEEQMHSNFAIILELTDVELAFIEEEPTRIFTNPILMQELCRSKGTNAHIVNLTLDSKVSIIFYMNALLEKYQSVSWVNPDNKFYIRRNLTPLLN